jgi:pectate lyase
MRKISICFLISLIPLISFGQKNKPLPAFPGAEGFGAYTQGGRGGMVYVVNTLEDYHPEKDEVIEGSFRQAVDAIGPRIIVFGVGGIIELKAPIHIVNSYITIAGQTAPGNGICLKNNSLVIMGESGEPVKEIIIRYLRVRPGDNRRYIGDKALLRDDGAFSGNDGIGIHNAANIILDHCSVSWGVDETFDVSGNVKNVTIQWCIISEGLHNSTNYKGPHSKGLMVGYNCTNFSLHHNLIMHCSDRNPYLPAEFEEPFIIDVVNNVVYNWWFNGGISYKKTNHSGQINFIGNYYIKGFNSWDRHPLTLGVNSMVYARDNIGPFRESSEQDEYDAILWEGPETNRFLKLKKPFDVPPVTIMPHKEAYHAILKDCGATLPERDQVDLRLIEELKLRKGQIIDHPSQVGGWPEMKNGKAPLDSDSDGMSDYWEIGHNLDPFNPSDAVLDSNNNGYTNIEEYINQITKAQPLITKLNAKGTGTEDDPLVILYSPAVILVDGDPEEWVNVSYIPRPYQNMAPSSLKLSWRHDGLYGMVEVKDSLLLIYESEPYRGDCFELFLDKLNEKNQIRDETRHAFQVIFSPTENLVPGHAAIIVPRDWPTQNLNFIYSRWKKTAQGYNIEFVIPALTMNPAILKKGTKIGVNFELNNDGNLTEIFADPNVFNTFFPVNWGTIILGE